MIPKSLHTVSVLVAVATYLQSVAHPHLGSQDLVDVAANLLGYTEADDVYGLKAAAVRKLEKNSAPAPRAARPMSGAAVMDSGREF